VLENQGREQVTITTMQPTVAELLETWGAPDNIERRRRAGQLAKERGVDMINVALAYVLQQPFPCLPLVGPRSLAETRSCARALSISLSAAELAWLDLRD
jgi:aryl-alcohol dehydrogenase-like predicted oxidoreductase